MRLRVSVAMAVHNGMRFLPQQVESVLGQLREDDELVVVDDASSDGSTEWLRSLDDPRLRLHVRAPNRGVRETFGYALAMVRGSIVFLSDQDDVWLPGKRDAFVAEFERKPQALVAVSDAEVIDAEGRVIAPSFMSLRGGFRGGWFDTLLRNRYLGCAMAFRRELLKAALPIPPGTPMHDMWLGMLGSLRGDVLYIAKPLMQYRRHGDNVNALRSAGLLQMLAWRLSIARLIATRLASLRQGHDGLASASVLSAKQPEK